MRGFLILFLLLSFHCRGQKILVFDRDGHDKRIRFRMHDEIEVRTADSALWLGGEIANIDDSTITVSDHVIRVSEITAIRYDTRSSGVKLLRGIASVLPAAGLALLSIYAINAVINDDYPIYSESTLIVSGAFIISKPVMYLLTCHKHKINKHHRLKVIDVSIR